MKFENTETFNFRGAFRGMRNPLNSWDKSDSKFGVEPYEEINDDFTVLQYWQKSDLSREEFPTLSNQAIDEYNAEKIADLDNNGYLRQGKNAVDYAFLGPNDLKLAQRLINGGPEHRKFLRQIMVSVDITAPLYIWKELDTYKIGTTANSTSTMHKLASTPITKDCFEVGDYHDDIVVTSDGATTGDIFETVIEYCESLRKAYNDSKDTLYWKELVRVLPESWLQTRTWTANYEVIRSIISQRRGHKLVEWKAFIDWARTLPYAEELIFYGLDA